MSDFAGLVAEVLRLSRDRITPELAFKQTDTWDSLTHMDLIAALEQSYGITLTAEEIVAMTTVERIIAVLAAHDRPVSLM